MTETPRPRRRWRIVLIALALLGAIAAFAVNRLLQPERVTAMLAAQARNVGLDLHLDGAARYAFLPRIAAVLPNATLLGADAKPLLAAQSIRAHVPWRSLWSGPLVIDDLVVEKPVLDLDALRAWLATRPPSDAPSPDVRLRIRIENAKIMSGDAAIAEGVDANLANDADLAAWLAGWSVAAPADRLAPPASGTLDARSLRIGTTRIEGLHVEIGADDTPPRKP